MLVGVDATEKSLAKVKSFKAGLLNCHVFQLIL